MPSCPIPCSIRILSDFIFQQGHSALMYLGRRVGTVPLGPCEIFFDKPRMQQETFCLLYEVLFLTVVRKHAVESIVEMNLRQPVDEGMVGNRNRCICLCADSGFPCAEGLRLKTT